MRKIIYAVAAAGFFFSILLAESPWSLPDGEQLFMKEKCISCHSFRGRGGATAPDLTAVAKRRSEGWIHDQIRYPEKHNPDTRMPSFEHLSRREIKAIVRYLRG